GPRVTHGAGPAGGDGVGELPRRERPHGALRRLRAVPLRPGQVAARPGGVHPGGVHLDQAVTGTAEGGSVAADVVVHRHEVEPDGGGSGGGPRVAVLVSLNFPDLTGPVAGLVRRFTRTTLTTVRELGARYALSAPSDAAPLP